MNRALDRLLLAGLFCAALSAATAHAEEPFDEMLWSCEYRPGQVDRKLCESSAEEFKKDYPAALKGGYGAQRNVAFCYESGCDGAVPPDLMKSCAWRMIIVANADARMGGGDLENLRRVCTRAGRWGKENALIMAKALYRKIYKRAFPEDIFF